MLSYIKQDLLSCSGKIGLSNMIKVILFSHAFHLVFFYRLGCSLSKIPIAGNFLRVLVEYFIRIFFSSDISLKSKIGPGLIFVHGHDIVIGGDVVIGLNCKILNGVTLGNKDTETTLNQQPKVGDNVVIGAGAKILGDIKIGSNVRIGANSVVLIDIPDDSTAVGVPARVV